MATYRIAWLPGDGVGREVMRSARRVLDALEFDAEYLAGDIGWSCWTTEGNPLPDRTMDVLCSTDACLFGAITSKPEAEALQELPPGLRSKNLQYFSPIVRVRQELNLHTNLRPCKAYPGNPLNHQEDIDLVIFRENTEGLYSGVEFHPVPEAVLHALSVHPKMEKFRQFAPDDIAISTRILTRRGCETILRQAFEYAKKHRKQSVTVVDKPNVLRETGGMMIRIAREIAGEYPDIRLQETNIDAQCMWLVKNPERYEVLVAENMFGDILSDLAAQLVGGLGFSCSANIGDDYAVFEPTHGSAPKYAGQHRVNPLAMLLSTRMMLEWLGEDQLSRRLETAISAVIAEGKIRTYDMGGNHSTTEMTEAVIANL